jgi:hypothetical protein
LILTLSMSAEVANADSIFGTPNPLPAPINLTGSNSLATAVSADGLELFFCSHRLGGYGSADV